MPVCVVERYAIDLEHHSRQCKSFLMGGNCQQDLGRTLTPTATTQPTARATPESDNRRRELDAFF
jgi:hypothetical protein